MKKVKVTVSCYGLDEVYCDWYKCNSCDGNTDIMVYFKYCPHCGREIDWKNSK